MAKIFKNWLVPEKINILIPRSLKTDLEGFRFLSEVYHRSKEAKHYIINFEKCEWIEANLCAILGAIMDVNTKSGGKFSIINLNENNYIKNTFRNNGFLEFLQNEKARTMNNSGIPFAIYDMKNEEEFEEYIYKYILSAPKMPNIKMSDAAKKKIFRSIFELYQNCVMHSGANNIYICGQYYVRKGRLALSMVEFGKTFKNNVQDHKIEYKDYAGDQCIKWAVESGNTTKKNDEAGGLGLDLIRDFLRKNNGKLQINSADGYWEEKKGSIFVKRCDFNFPGSIVNIEFNLYDKANYYTKEELNISDIL